MTIPVDRSRKRERMLKAALSVFAEKGYDGATIADIAERASVAKGLVYDYFESKEDLFSRLFDRVFGHLESELEVPPPLDGDPLEAIVHRAREILLQYEAVGSDVNVIAQFWARGQAKGAGGRFLEAWKERYRSCRERVSALLEEARASGLVREDVDPQRAAWAVVAMIDGSVLQWLHRDDMVSLVGCATDGLRTLLSGMAPASERRAASVSFGEAMTDCSVGCGGSDGGAS
jgi:AcrR family transcriptional regulator